MWPLGGWLLGFLLGLGHALEPDHLAAVSSLVVQRGPARRGRVEEGLWWGIGHASALCLLGGLFVLFHRAVPPRLEQLFELAVACLLVALGARAVQRSFRGMQKGAPVEHQHGLSVHTHPTGAPHVHVGRWVLARRPLFIGLLHGVAGSGTLVALVFASLPSTGARLGYMLWFGLGSIVGMTALAGLGGRLWSSWSHRPRTQQMVTRALGSVTFCLGLGWAYPILAAWV